MELLKGFNVEEGKEYIYLVMVEYKDKTLLKIGYTKTIEGRMDTYELHNPDIQLLKIREGTRNLENYMHRKFEKYAYPKRKEWFYYNEEIINGFNVLEEKNFLDINQLKNRVYNFLKPKSIDSLKEMYYEKYHEEIENECIDEEDLDTLITNTFYFINEKIKNFILSFDYSEIPLELDLSTHYQIIIPNPISSVDISIDLEQILGKPGLKENPWKNYVKIFVKVTDFKHKTIKEEFYHRLEEKKQNSIKLLESFTQVDEKNRHVLAEAYQKIARTYHYEDDYISVNEQSRDELVPVFNDLMMVSEMRSFEVQQIDYATRESIFNAISERKLV